MKHSFFVYAFLVFTQIIGIKSDSNPCSGWGVCSQLCSHDIVSHIHRCDCLPGYVLQRDSYTCSPNDSITNYILFTSGREIRRLDVKQQTSVSLVSGLRDTVALDFAYNHTGGNGDHSLVFWTDDYGRKIYRGKLISNSITNIQPVLIAEASSIAVDWITQHLYWVEDKLNQIEVAAFDGKQRITLVAGSMERPRAIVVDPRHGILFWSDLSYSYPRIEKISMSGRGREVIFNVSSFQGGGRPFGLTVDYEATRLYWTDDQSDSIHTILYDGSDHHTVLHDPEFISFRSVISVFGNHVYWTEYERGLLLQANKWTGDHVEVIHKTTTPSDLKVFHPKRQPIVSNPCEKDNGGCHGDAICLLGYNRTAECRCPHLKQLALDNRSCEYEKSTGSSSSIEIVAPLVVAVVLLIVIVVVVVTLLIRQRKRLTAQQESMELQTHSLQSLHHSEPHAEAEVEAILYEEIQDVAASIENTGHMAPMGHTGEQAGSIYLTQAEYETVAPPVTQSAYERPGAAGDERPRPAVYEKLKKR